MRHREVAGIGTGARHDVAYELGSWLRHADRGETFVEQWQLRLFEIAEHEVKLTTETGEVQTLSNDVVFVLVGSDADLTMLKQLGVKAEPGKLAEVPVYDPETFETNVRGVYVAGHFTHARHIKAAIDVPRRIVPLIAKELKAGK